MDECKNSGNYDEEEEEKQMRKIACSDDYDDPVLAEIYDLEENHTDDVNLLRQILRGHGRSNILECFSGTGRILIPLAKGGHKLTGLEIADAMIARARTALADEDEATRARVTLRKGDVLTEPWGEDYDVVILGGNCLYELPSPERQEECIRRAALALRKEGYLFVDTNEGSGHGTSRSEIGWEWRSLCGTTKDQVRLQGSARVVDVDDKGAMHFIRTWVTEDPDGKVHTQEYLATKYCVSGEEVEGWLAKHQFRVLEKFGGYKKEPYGKHESPRAIFWAQKA
jgi:SAM-dependent methyltransferase